MATGQPFWTDPLKNDNTEDEALTTFCLPIYDLSGKCVGVLAADVSIKLLSDIVLAAKPSANGYAAMLARNGSYIVHPNQEKLTKGNAFSLLEKNSDPALKKIIKAMLNEESGSQNFNMDGRGWYVVYKPFQRSVVDGRAMESLNWSIALVYPEDDIVEGNNQLLYLVITIIVIGLLVFSVLCRMVIHRQLLPLSMLTQWAQHFTKGHFDNIVPDTDREDEIGRLQRNFQKMQLSLTTQIKELERLTNQLNERGEVLQQANDKTQEADIMKTTFLHHMTKRLLEPTDTIDKSVTELCNRYQDISSEEAAKKIELIHQNSETVIGLINDMLQTAESETGKEGSHAQD
jgi:methyl-accepting chemotaxis protein/sigma-B regulation protein RsbU (phosphoserine phosphatase)